MITANCHSDDWAVEVSFDATGWFKQASADDIKRLALCGWGGDYPADVVAEFFGDTCTSEMFDYIRITQRGRRPVGFECYVNEDSARCWIDSNRSDVSAMLNALDDEIMGTS